VTPDGDHLLIASGGTTGMEPEGDENHAIFRVDADRDSDTFGEVTAQIETGYVGPCDMTLGPDGDYAFVVDVADEAIRVLTVDPFETVARVGSGEPVTEGNVLPFMCTAAFDGEYLLVENGEGTLGGDPEVPREGSESLWDISDPERPRGGREDHPRRRTARCAGHERGVPGQRGRVPPHPRRRRRCDRLEELRVRGDAGRRRKQYLRVVGAEPREAVRPGSRRQPGRRDRPREPRGRRDDRGRRGAHGCRRRYRPPGERRGVAGAGVSPALGITFGEMEASWCMDDHCYCG